MVWIWLLIVWCCALCSPLVETRDLHYDSVCASFATVVSSEEALEVRWHELDIKAFSPLVYLGRGVSSEVFTTLWAEDGSVITAAVKRFRDANDQALKEVQKEARYMTLCQSPYIVALLGASTMRPPYGLVMEYLDGGSLRDLLQEDSHLPLRVTLSVFFDVLRGLAVLHSHNIVHRDIRPENILLSTTGHSLHAKLGDLGSAQELQPSLTLTEKVGTWRCKAISPPPFAGTGMTNHKIAMAPEMMRGQSYSEKIDIYGIGLSLFELLEGAQPYNNLEVDTLVVHVLEGGRPELAKSPWYPIQLQQLVTKCWDADPSERPSAKEILVELENISIQLGPDDDPEPPKEEDGEVIEIVLEKRREEPFKISWKALMATESLFRRLLYDPADSEGKRKQVSLLGNNRFIIGGERNEALVLEVLNYLRAPSDLLRKIWRPRRSCTNDLGGLLEEFNFFEIEPLPTQQQIRGCKGSGELVFSPCSQY